MPDERTRNLGPRSLHKRADSNAAPQVRVIETAVEARQFEFRAAELGRSQGWRRSKRVAMADPGMKSRTCEMNDWSIKRMMCILGKPDPHSVLPPRPERTQRCRISEKFRLVGIAATISN